MSMEQTKSALCAESTLRGGMLTVKHILRLFARTHAAINLGKSTKKCDATNAVKYSCHTGRGCGFAPGSAARNINQATTSRTAWSLLEAKWRLVVATLFIVVYVAQKNTLAYMTF